MQHRRTEVEQHAFSRGIPRRLDIRAVGTDPMLSTHLRLNGVAIIFSQWRVTNKAMFRPYLNQIGGWQALCGAGPTDFGYGPSLHVVAGPSSLDSTALAFTNSNFGGTYSASFTAHIDSAWASNPIGALLHLIIDVLGHNTRNPCPK
jgi:hypothetical protein